MKRGTVIGHISINYKKTNYLQENKNKFCLLKVIRNGTRLIIRLKRK